MASVSRRSTARSRCVSRPTTALVLADPAHVRSSDPRAHQRDPHPLGSCDSCGFWSSPGEPRRRGSWRTISRVCRPSSTSCAGRATHNLGSTGSGTGRPHSSPGCICRGCACVISMPARSRGSITGASRARYRASAGPDAPSMSAATDPTSHGFWTISQTPGRSSLGVAPSGRTGSASQASALGSHAPETSAPGESTTTSSRSKRSCPPWERFPSRMMRR